MSYLLITGDKEESLKAGREKKGKIMDPRSTIRTDFSQKALQKKREWDNTVKILKGKKSVSLEFSTL